MKTLLLILACLIGLAFSAEAATYYADPAGGGAATCVDTGANVCTIARAIVVAATGDTVQAACGTYSQAATTLAVNKNITIAPLTAGCGIITGTNTTSIVAITASNDANVLTFGAFEVQNTGGATSSTVQIATAAYDATVELSGTIISVAGTNRHLVDQWVRGTIKLTNMTFTGTMGAQAAIYSVTNPTSAKKIQVTGGTFTLTSGATNTPAILIERAALNTISEWAYVANNTVNITVPSALGASALGIGIRLNRITDGTNLSGVSQQAIIENNTVTVTTLTSTGSDAFAIVVSSTDATARADNVIIRDNTVTCNGPATRCLSVGTDSVTLYYADNVQIYRNTISNPFYDGASTPHCLHVGRVTGGYAWGNKINGCSVGILISINQGAVVTGNLIIGAYNVGLFSKGSGGTTAPTIANNTVIMDDAILGAKTGNYGCMGVAVQGATVNTATNFYSNICIVRNGTGWKYAVVDTGQAATFDKNNYYSTPTLTTPWSYTGTTYASVALWNAAATVADDTSSDPQIVSASDLRLLPASPLRRTGKAWGFECIGYRGSPCLIPPHVGAHQDRGGDLAPIRTKR